MRFLKFVVEGQRIRPDPACDFSGITAGTRGYLVAEFKFSSDWDRCRKAAVFTHGDETEAAPLEKCSCVIPERILAHDYFMVSVIGEKEGYRITSGKTTVRQEKGAWNANSR